MHIRRATHEDASSLAALSIEVWLATYIREGVNAFFADYALNEFTTAKFENLLSNVSETLWVSENTVGIDGFVQISNGNKAPVAGCSDMEIAKLYVQKRHQGRGVGLALLNKALEQGAPWLMVNAENAPAVEFYKSQGFTPMGETFFCIQDKKYLNYILARKGK